MKRSFLGQRWHYRSDTKSPDGLARELGINPLTAKLLAARGIDTREAAVAFLDPGLHRLLEPTALAGVERAATRIAQSIVDQEPIGVYGDYDVDGQTGTALLVRVIRELGGKPIPYIPNRIDEGYGLNIPAMKSLVERGSKAIVTVDCGISSIDEARWAKDHGIDLVVTDHHQPPPHLPDAYAIVDPALDLKYPGGPLAGCGVAFKVACATARQLEGNANAVMRYVDLVALGTVADVVPLLGENRSLVKVGLERLSSDETLIGLKALKEVAGIEGKVTAGQVGFVLAPRLNAAGRIGDPMLGLRLLLTDDEDEALELASLLDRVNTRRQEIEERVVDDCIKLIERDTKVDQERALVVAKEGWHPGVIGIAASRLTELFYRPAVVLAIDGDEAKGSGRSIPGFDLYEAVSRCSRHLERFGGHRAAAGMTVKASALEEFALSFYETAKDMLSPEDLVPALEFDDYAELDRIDLDFLEELALLEPHGPGNPAPVLVCQDAAVTARPVGRDQSHLRFDIRSLKSDSSLDGIGFGLAERLARPMEDTPLVDLAFTPQINEWNGRRKPSLRVRDVRPAQSLLGPAPTLLRALREVAVTYEVEGNHLSGQFTPSEDERQAVGTATWRIADLRQQDPVHALKREIAAGKPCYLIAATAKDAREIAADLADDPVLKPLTTAWHDDAPQGALDLIQQALSTDRWVVVAATPPPVSMNRADVSIFVWQPPLSPGKLVRHLAWCAKHGDELKLQLSFDRQGIETLSHRLEALYPDRERLGRIYIHFKRHFQGEIISRQDGAAVARAIGLGVLPETVDAACQIFAELGLVEATEGGWRLLPEPAGKVDLEKSLRYNESNIVKEGFSQYASLLLQVPPSGFIEALLGLV